MPHSSSPYEVIIVHHHATCVLGLERSSSKLSFSCDYPNVFICGFFFYIITVELVFSQLII